MLDWSIRLTNVRGASLRFGSPATAGRGAAGYTGLHWRGPAGFAGGSVTGPGQPPLPGEAGAARLMGRQSEWLAFTGRHDTGAARSTLVFVHAPGNSDAIHPSHWFVRSEPYATVSFSWAFHEEFELPPGASFRYGYRVVVADGAWDTDWPGSGPRVSRAASCRSLRRPGSCGARRGRSPSRRRLRGRRSTAGGVPRRPRDGSRSPQPPTGTTTGGCWRRSPTGRGSQRARHPGRHRRAGPRHLATVRRPGPRG